MFSTRVERGITSTVTVTASPTTAQLSSATGNGLGSSYVNATSSVIKPSSASQGLSVTEGLPGYSSLFVQTTGVPQGTPSLDLPTSANGTTPSGPDPTAPPFTCPEDDAEMISQMLGNERFDYDVFCDTDLPDAPELSPELKLTYDTFAECVASCSYANAQFDQPVCQGVSYFGRSSEDGNCFLKSAANESESVTTDGVAVAILRSIAVGHDNGNGTTTELVSFSTETPTMDPAEMGSMIASMMGSSVSTMPIITPPPGPILSGRPALNGVTAYSTYVANGTTFSTGSAFSTNVSSNGGWYYTYYSSFSLAWVNSATVYAVGETAVPIAYNSSGVTEQHDGANGQYSVLSFSNYTEISYEPDQTVYKTTELIGNDTFAANGTELFATTTTNYYTYTEASNNGVSGGAGSGDAGNLTSTSISSFSTQTVIISSGNIQGATGNQASGVFATPGPTATTTSAFSTQSIILNSGATSGGEGAEASGAAGPTGPAGPLTSTSTISTQTVILNSGAASGAVSGVGSGLFGSTGPAGTITSTSSFSVQTVIVSSGGSQGVVGGVASGAGGSALPEGSSVSVSTQAIPISIDVSSNGVAGATGLAGSGVVSSTAVSGAPPSVTDTLVDISTVLTSGGTGGVFSTAASGANSNGETSGATSTAASGATTPSPTGTFTNSRDQRNRTESGSTTMSLPTSIQSVPTVPNLNQTASLATGISSDYFSNSNKPRTGTVTTSILSGTNPLSSPPLSTESPSNVTVTVATGTVPLNLTVSELTSADTASFSNRPRSGTFSTTSTRPQFVPFVQTLAPPVEPSSTGGNTSFATSGQTIPLSTSPPLNVTSPPFPTAPPATSCLSYNVSTTTLWMTTTLLGCFEQCPPGGNGVYGFKSDGYGSGPQSFGPPVGIFAPSLAGNPTPEPTPTSPSSTTER